jgi:tetratricopeptide (TPR) repeat protein
MARGRALAIAAAGLALAMGPPARASSAQELVRIAKAHETAHEEDVAVRRYMEALSLDPTCDEAYLGLGSLRARRGDLREADRVYTMALEHHPQLRTALTARAYVRRAMGLRDEAAADLLAGAEDEPGALRVLATWYGQDGQIPAELAIWRRLAARAEVARDVVLLHEARTMVRALVILVGPADPAAAPPQPSGVRRLAATLSRRGG